LQFHKLEDYLKMTNKLFIHAVALTALVVAGLPAKAQIRGGSRAPMPADLSQRLAAAEAQFPSVLANALSPESVAATLRLIKGHPSPTTAGLTNFDNVSAPCDFPSTSPLLGLEQFAGFAAPAPDGGAVLNECSGFGVNPHSPPNFLAFNDITGYYDPSGIPKTPELIYVAKTTSNVSLWISGGDNPSYPYAVVAYGSTGVLGVVPAHTTEEWIQISLNASGIIAIGLVGNPGYLLVDDILAQ
jgi:hypothetical protein